MTLVGFAILVIIAAVVITHSNKSLPPPVLEEEPVEELESQKPSLALVVFWISILVATIALGLYGIWLNV